MIPATSLCTGALTTATTVRTGRAHLFNVLVRTDGTNAATVTVYDNTSAAGKVLLSASVAGANNQELFDFSYPPRADNGLHVTVSGTGASVIVYYG